MNMETREIKFRAWDGEEMHYNIFRLSFHFEDKDGIMAEVINPRFAKAEYKDKDELCNNIFPDKLILLQYTGLKDKNGKEIYEGDIITCVSKNDFKWPAKGTVEYLPSSAGFAINVGQQLLDSENSYYAHFWSHVDFEIIGNIYSNPELLPSPAASDEYK